jgi:surface-anchored protein
VESMKKVLIAAILFAAAASPALAYTGFLLPQDFWPASGTASVQASYATQFFTPSVALGGDFQVIGPNGQPGILSGVEVGANATSLAVDTPDAGTYLLTTGEQLGRVTTLVATPDGQWRPLGQGETAPAGAQTNTLQTVTVSSVYLTRGAPNRTAVDHPVGRLALHPITDPNQIVQASGFQVELLFDGHAFTNMPIVVYAANDPDTKLDRFVVTGTDGRANLTFDQPGRYVLAVRYRANAPPGSAANVQSYTTTLTVDVMAAPHALSQVGGPARVGQAQHRRRQSQQHPAGG